MPRAAAKILEGGTYMRGVVLIQVNTISTTNEEIQHVHLRLTEI